MAVLLKDAIKPNLLQTLEGGPGVRPLRAVREHRPRQQLGARRPDRARDERDRLHGGGIRRGHGRREVLRHQVPGVRPATRRGRRRRHDPGAEDARRRRQDRRRQAARSGAARGERRRGHRGRREPREADRERAPVQRAGRRRDQLVPDGHARPRSRRSRRCRWPPAPATPSSPTTGRRAARERRISPTAVWAAAEEGAPDFKLLYPDDASLTAKIETIATQVYGADGVDLSAGRREAARAVRVARLREAADLHGQEPVLAQPRRRRSRAARPASACRSARSGSPRARDSSRRSRARCGRCRACRRRPGGENIDLDAEGRDRRAVLAAGGRYQEGAMPMQGRVLRPE